MDSAAPQCKSVFVWRYEQTGDFGRPKVHRNCIWCDTTLLWDNYWIGDKSDVYDAFCPLCGWFGTRTVKDWSDYEHHARDEVVSFGYAWQNCLKEFDLSSDELQLEELASHLARNYSDIYSLNPRRFEKLVTESPRDLRRLQNLREWSHEQIESFFPRSPRACSAHGARASQGAPIPVGRH